MANWAGATGFLAVAAATSLAWGKTLWYCNERSDAFRRGLFFVISLTHARSTAVQSLLLSATYYTFGFLAAGLFGTIFRVPVPSLFSWSRFSWPLLLLGVIGEISLAGLLVELGCRIPTHTGPEQLAEEISEIPWIKGIEQLPAVVVPVLAAMGGALEELFFRGVLLAAMIDRYHFNAPIAIAITTALFCVQQVLQVRTPTQALLMSWSCVSISVIGGLLVVLTGNVAVSMLCHASFALFWVGRSLNTSAFMNRRMNIR
jgi:membrane protease YdiL (CAAX protease family)